MWIDSAALNLEVKDDKGGGPALLLVHGAGGGAALWSELMGRLPGELKVAALDLSGHGGSPDKENYMEPDTYVGDVQAAISALGGGPPVICGHSMGGAVAMLTALRHPESVSALVLAGTGARLRVLPAIFGQLKADFPAAVGSMCDFSFPQESQGERAKLLTETMLKTGRETAIRDFTLCDNFDIMAEAGKIDHPTLVVCGERDMMTPPKYSKWLHENIPNTNLHIIPGCGHMLMMEVPGELANLIGEFLKSL
ncbi:MAG: alpha/beta hydrolase [bacterium]